MISLRRERGGFSIDFAFGQLGPGHPGDLVGQCDSGNLGRSSRQQCGEPRSVAGTMDFGITDHCERPCNEQSAEIPIALLADATEPLFTAT